MRDSSLDKLVYHASSTLAEKLIEHFTQRMNEPGEGEEAEELQEQLVTAIARPITYGCLPLKYAPDVLVYYGQAPRQANEIIKLAISKMRKRDRTEEWKIIFSTLSKVGL